MRLKRNHLLLASIWLVSAMVIHGIIWIPDDALRLTLAFVLLYIFPGYLTVYVFKWIKSWKQIQLLAIAAGLGLTEALVLGQIALIFGLRPVVLAHAILLLTAAKVAWIAHLSFVSVPKIIDMDKQHSNNNRWGFMIQAGWLVFAVLFVFIQYRQIPVYTWSPSDTWYYTQVQVQFSTNPGQMNVQDGITAPGTNRRLTWNSWLYNRAMLVDVTAEDPVIVQQRDGLYALILLVVVIYIALGQTLLEDHQAGWLAAFFQFSIVILGQAEFLLRLPEDKYISFYALIPLVLMLILRLMRDFTRQNFILFVFLTVGLSLVHPFNPIALFLTGIAFVVLRWLIVRDKLFIIKTLPVALWMVILLAYPLVMEHTLTEDPLVAGGMATSTAFDWSYHLTGTWDTTLRQPDYITAMILLPVLIVFALRSRYDIAAQFLLAVSAAIILLLWIPPFAALGVRVMTRSQNWRIFMLLPIGFGWAWLILHLWQWGWPLLQRRGIKESMVRVLWGGGIPLILALLWGWPGRMGGIVFLDSAKLSEAGHIAFAKNRDQVGSSRVLTTDQLSQALPTLWPNARLAFSRSGILQPDAYHDLTAVMNNDPSVDLAKTLTKYGIKYLLLPHDVPLAWIINTTWSCCVNQYENDELSLFEFRYPLPTNRVQVGEIEVQTDFHISDFATLRGYTLISQPGTLFLILYWQPVRQTEVPYTTYVHLLGDNNPVTGTTLWSQDDHPPRLGQTPTTNWEVGSLIRDMYRMDIPDLPNGAYTISIGMYNSATIAHVLITDKNGQSLGDDLPLLTWTNQQVGN